MFEGNLYKQIVPLLGWTALNRAKEYSITNKSGEVIDNVRLRSFWIGEIIHLQHQPPLNELVIMVMETTYWRKGLILVPPFHEPLDRVVGGPDPHQPVDLGEWQDPFSTLLESAPLFPGAGHEERQQAKFSCTIKIAHRASVGEFAFFSPLKKDVLWENLNSTIQGIAKQYNNNEMDMYIQYLMTSPSK